MQTIRKQFGVIILLMMSLMMTTSVSADSLTVNEIRKLTASDGAQSFGESVAVNGDILVVTAVGDSSPGAAYIFYRNQGGNEQWGEVKKLSASDATISDSFGYSASVSGDILVIGAHGVNSGQGAAYIFYRNQGGTDQWGQVAKIIASDGAADDGFGASVSVNNDIVVVGSPQKTVNANSGQGAAYVFYRNQGGTDQWGQIKKLTVADGTSQGFFGRSVSISNDTLVIGAFQNRIGSNYFQGAAYIFYRNQDGTDQWGQVKKLTASDGMSDDYFGYSVSVSGDRIAASAPNKTVSTNNGQGAAYLFYRNQGGAEQWGEVRKITSSDGISNDGFGLSLSLDSDILIVGDARKNSYQGSAYLFYRNQGGTDQWGESRIINPSDVTPQSWFGYSVSAEDNTLVIGSLSKGASYVYSVSQQTIPGHGNMNGDGKVDLADAILALKILVEVPVTVIINPNADVNGDKKIGAEEVIYVLQFISGLR